MAIKRSSKITSNFSMASMTDIIFLLLIFFLVTSTLINPNALRLLLPKSNSQTSSKQKVSVSIKQLGDDKFDYYVNRKRVEFNEIERNLQLELINVEDPVVSLYTDESVPIGQVVKMMNIAAKNDFKMILATERE
ncbi:MAG: biopolymer transporter ExbD [Prevotellaceae bacterium]|nr:biopolymer transporter ExbD [Prevotellaceae bacterium]